MQGYDLLTGRSVSYYWSSTVEAPDAWYADLYSANVKATDNLDHAYNVVCIGEGSGGSLSSGFSQEQYYGYWVDNSGSEIFYQGVTYTNGTVGTQATSGPDHGSVFVRCVVETL